MKANIDLFQRSMTPGASAAASAHAASSTSDEALPMPKDAGSVLPSAVLAQIPPVSTITASTDCSLGELNATIERERKKATEQQSAYYGNPGNSGLGRTPAEQAVLEHAEDSDLELCGSPMKFATSLSPEWQAVEEQQRNELDAIGLEESNAWNACPGISGGKDPECERAVSARSAQKIDEMEKRHLRALSPLFGNLISEMQACAVKREAIVKEAHAANVIGRT
jgi:hypothetical protein